MAKSNTCGQVMAETLGKKITVHRKQGETCAEARERVRKKWAKGNSPAPSTPPTGGISQKLEGQL